MTRRFDKIWAQAMVACAFGLATSAWAEDTSMDAAGSFASSSASAASAPTQIATVSQVPEPQSYLLLLAGGCALGAMVWRRIGHGRE